jgi:hypothetical protein
LATDHRDGPTDAGSALVVDQLEQSRIEYFSGRIGDRTDVKEVRAAFARELAHDFGFHVDGDAGGLGEEAVLLLGCGDDFCCHVDAAEMGGWGFERHFAVDDDVSDVEVGGEGAGETGEED